MGILTDVLKDKKTVAILGHVNPDGDCIGSCLAMYNYLTENYGELRVSVYLEPMGAKFGYLKGYGQVKHGFEPERTFDLCITLDASDEKRLGEFAPYLKTAADSLCRMQPFVRQRISSRFVQQCFIMTMIRANFASPMRILHA